MKGRRVSAIITILEDQKWHSVGEIAKAIGASEDGVEGFLQFMAKYEFVLHDR